MLSKGRNIIVIGTSAGGLEALDDLIGQLRTDIPASIFVVQHMPPDGSAEPLLKRLGRHNAFRSKLAADGEPFERGRIYVAPPDYHLLVKGTKLLVTKGARENRSRPGIDPLFRSAAVTHGPHVIGVVLTGMLDDGTAGLIAIQKCGGVTVVQDPAEASYPGMAESALSNLQVDHCVRLGDMGALLDRLTREPARHAKPIPEDVKTEALIAERVLSDVLAVDSLGDLVPYNCPNCGGVLWNVEAADTTRFRCHTGHSFTAAALLASQAEKIERDAMGLPADVRGAQEPAEQPCRQGKLPRDVDGGEGPRGRGPHRTHPRDPAGTGHGGRTGRARIQAQPPTSHAKETCRFQPCRRPCAARQPPDIQIGDIEHGAYEATAIPDR